MSTISEVGLVGAHLAQHVLGIAGLGDDLDALALEQAHDPLAQQNRVLADDDAHGSISSLRGVRSRAASRVPSPTGLSSSNSPPSAVDPVAKSDQPGAAVEVGPASAVVGDRHNQAARPSRDTSTRTASASAWRAALVRLSATT